MIDNVAFTGREEMLTAGLSKGIRKSYEYLGAGKIFSKKEIEAGQQRMSRVGLPHAVKVNYTSPYDINPKTETAIEETAANNRAYALSHGNPKEIAETAIHKFVAVG